jgi:hypothetical protein
LRVQYWKTPTGHRLGVLARNADLEDIKIARQRLASDEERVPFSAVLEHLSTLETSLESQLLEGINSGPAISKTAEDWAQMRSRVAEKSQAK